MRCSYLLLSMLLVLGLQAQDPSTPPLPMVEASEITGDFSENLNHTDDYQTILRIYNDLVQARGDYRSPKPELFLKDVEGFVAFMSPSTNSITIEKKAYDVVKQYGDVGIAFLLGHELIHHYEKHAWKEDFVFQNESLTRRSGGVEDTTTIVYRLNRIQDGVIHETEADYLGGFLTYSAGYGLFDQGDSLIAQLYRAYDLPEALAKYPTLSERIELAGRSAKKMALLVDAFEMANYLYAMGDYSTAYAYYKSILRQYQSRELYNNLGTISVLNAMMTLDDGRKYRYVTTMDLNMKGSRDVTTSVLDAYDEHLKQALFHFNAAINLDPGYAPAYLNKANVYALKKDWVKASFYLEQEALPIAKEKESIYKKTLLDIKVLQGIIAANRGKKNKARSHFEEAKAKGSKLAGINLFIHNTGSAPEATTGESPIDVPTEAIDGITAMTFFNRQNLKFLPAKKVPIDHEETMFQFTPLIAETNEERTDTYRVLFTRNSADKFQTSMFMPGKDFTGSTSNGISIGDSREVVISKNGSPVRTIETTEGALLVYEDLLFIIKDNKVSKWVLSHTTRF